MTNCLTEQNNNQLLRHIMMMGVILVSLPSVAFFWQKQLAVKKSEQEQ